MDPFAAKRSEADKTTVSSQNDHDKIGSMFLPAALVFVLGLTGYLSVALYHNKILPLSWRPIIEQMSVYDAIRKMFREAPPVEGSKSKGIFIQSGPSEVKDRRDVLPYDQAARWTDRLDQVSHVAIKDEGVPEKEDHHSLGLEDALAQVKDWNQVNVDDKASLSLSSLPLKQSMLDTTSVDATDILRSRVKEDVQSVLRLANDETLLTSQYHQQDSSLNISPFLTKGWHQLSQSLSSLSHSLKAYHEHVLLYKNDRQSDSSRLECEWISSLLSLVQGWQNVYDKSTLLASDIFEEKHAALQQQHIDELRQLRESLTAQYHAELAWTLSHHEQALLAEWNANLQERMDKERDGRLARLAELSQKVQTIKSRHEAQALRLAQGELLCGLQFSVHTLLDIIHQGDRLDDSDEAALADLLWVNGCHHVVAEDLQSMAPAKELDRQFRTALAERWRRKMDTDRQRFQTEWFRMADNVQKMQRLVDVMKEEKEQQQVMDRSDNTQSWKDSVALFRAAIDSAHFSSVESFTALKDQFSPLKSLLLQSAHVPSYAPFLSHCLSYLAATALLFRKHGLVPGNDTPAVLSRVDYWLEKGDLDLAARELRTLRDVWPVLLSRDWLARAVHCLEVRQALSIIKAESSAMASLFDT